MHEHMPSHALFDGGYEVGRGKKPDEAVPVLPVVGDRPRGIAPTLGDVVGFRVELRLAAELFHVNEVLRGREFVFPEGEASFGGCEGGDKHKPDDKRPGVIE